MAKGQTRRLWAILMAGVALPAMGQELPSGATVVAGDVVIGSAPGQMEIGQTSQYGIVDWTSFGIGAGAGVHFANGTGATLNRVTGGEASALLGSLTGTGSVYLINPSGVVIGPNGRVQTGGRFVASTLDVENGDFLNGGALSFAGSGGMVLNLGQVGSSGGDVALIAGDVVNRGSLTAPEGTVGLAAGRKVVLRDAALDEGLISVVVGGGDVTDEGAIRSAAAELRARDGNVLALAGNTEGVIEAKGVEKVAGRVFLTAPGGKVTVDSQVTADRAITVTGAEVDLSGRLAQAQDIIVKAEGETSFTGMIQSAENGFVELSGAHLTFDGVVDQGGGTLLIDPRNIEINEGNSNFLSDATVIAYYDLISMLSTGSVILDTSTPDTGAAGTIAVLADVVYESANALTLLAMGDIWVLGHVQNSGAGDVTAVAGWDGATSFSAGTFDAAALASTTVFGNAGGAGYTLYTDEYSTSGTVHVGDPNLVFGASFGSGLGATRVYGAEVQVSGGAGSEGFVTPYAQIGRHLEGNGDLGTASGAITVRATGSVQVVAGSAFDSYALIGHGGNAFAGDSTTPTSTLSGAIRVEAGQDITLAGAVDETSTDAYAMIGHGSADEASWMAEGDRSGTIEVTAGGELSLVDGASYASRALIGHETGFGTITGSVDVTAARADLSLDAADASVVDVAMWALDTDWGEVHLTLTDSDATLQGSTAFLDDESFSITTDHDFVLDVSGTLTLAEGFQYGNDGLGGLVLAAERVTNLSSEPFLDIGGGWYVYTTRPDWDTGMMFAVSPALLSYGTAFSAADPRGGFGSGSVLAFAVTPVVVTDDASIAFGQSEVPVVSHLRVGTEEVDPEAFGISLSPQVDYEAVEVTGDDLIAAGLWEDALYAEVGTEIPVQGYQTQRGALLVTGGGGGATPPERGVIPVNLVETPFDPEPPSLRGAMEVIDTETTGRILEEIKSGTDFCREFVDPEYAVDCLSDRLQSVADGLSATGEYAEVRAALEDAATQLHDLALKNASDELSRSIARATDGTGRTSGRPLTAIDPARLQDANAEAAAIIANTQLVLLRSAADSDRRRVAFQQVGQVLGSTVVLLRS